MQSEYYGNPFETEKGRRHRLLTEATGGALTPGQVRTQRWQERKLLEAEFGAPEPGNEWYRDENGRPQQRRMQRGPAPLPRTTEQIRKLAREVYEVSWDEAGQPQVWATKDNVLVIHRRPSLVDDAAPFYFAVGAPTTDPAGNPRFNDLPDENIVVRLSTFLRAKKACQHSPLVPPVEVENLRGHPVIDPAGKKYVPPTNESYERALARGDISMPKD